jgi:hypothetical protein
MRWPTSNHTTPTMTGPSLRWRAFPLSSGA